MKPMKKLVAFSLSALLAFGCSALSACGRGGVNDVDPEIYAVYTAYTEGGGTLSYDEWYAQLLESAKGLKGDKGDKGDPGEQGIQGVPGVAGNNGNSFLHGNGSPSPEIGMVGDLYVDIATWEVYEKTEAGWSAQPVGTLQGEQGETGPQGTAGSSFLHGHGVPQAETLGKQGDLYLDIDTWNVYEMTESGWSTQPIGNIKGSKGDQGDRLPFEVTNETYGSFWLRCHDYKTMPVGTYNAVTYALRENEELFAAYKEAGVNMLIGCWEGFSPRTLDLCAENGLGYFLSAGNPNGNYDQTALGNLLSQAKYHEAFCGVTVADEPTRAYFETIATTQEFLDSQLPETIKGALWWSNLFPNYADEKSQLYGGEFPEEFNGSYPYQQYVDDYMEICKPKVLSFDNYGFHVGKKKRNTVRADYFQNLSVIRNAALKANVPFWHFVQNCQFNKDSFAPTLGELLWSVNTGLSYGAKGIEYFTGVKAFESAHPKWEGAMFDGNGNRTDTYALVKKANQQIAAVDEVLMCSRSKGIIVVGTTPTSKNNDLPCEIPAIDTIPTYGELSSQNATHALIGCFDYNGKTAFYITNNSITEKDEVTLNFNSSISGYTVQNAVKMHFVGNSVKLSLDEGEGVLVVID